LATKVDGVVTKSQLSWSTLT